MIEKSFECEWEPYIHVLGRPSGVIKTFSQSSLPLKMNADKQTDKIQSNAPNGIAYHNGTMAVIDQKGCLWIVGSVFCQPVNISDLVRMKAKKVFLGEGQLIFQSKRKGMILIAWATKPEFKIEKLRKLVVNNGPWSHLIDAFAIEQDIEDGSLWYYSSVKKLQNTIKLYQLNIIDQEIVGFPTGKKIQIPSRPVGLSLGKYHGLLWTEEGQLYSWGIKNLGLGLYQYHKSYYDELEKVKMPQKVVKAIASTSYSVALGASGTIYEWGTTYDGRNIVSPKSIPFKGLYFVDLKGFQHIFGGLTSTNELYVWGKDIDEFLSIKKKGKNEPYHINKAKNIKILDFQIQQTSVLVMITQGKGGLSHQENQYFSEVLKKVSTKWLPHRQKKVKNVGFKQNIPKTPTSSPRCVFQGEDYIDRLVNEKISKQKYFQTVQDQQKIFTNIMSEYEPSAILKAKLAEELRSTQNNIKSRRTVTHKKYESARVTPSWTVDEFNANRLINEFDQEKKRKKNLMKKIKMAQNNHIRQHLSYEERSLAAAQRRERLQEQRIQQTTMKRKQTQKSRHNLDSFTQEDMFQHVHLVMKKLYVLKFIMAPLNIAKMIKTKQKMNEKCFDRVSVNMKNILYRQRTIQYLKQLSQQQPSKYINVKRILVRAVRRWKKKKVIKNRKIIIQCLFHTTLSHRIKCGLGKMWLNTRKVEKMCQWFIHDQNDRLLHLRCQWKKSLLLFIKPTPSFQNKNPLAVREQLNVKPIEKVKPVRLDKFIKDSPICHLNIPFVKTISFLKANRNKAKQKEEHVYHSQPSMKKGVSWAQFSNFEFKNENFCQTFTRDTERKITAIDGILDIMLYSNHYDCFFKPKNCQINIPDNMKQSDKWISEQKKIFEKILKTIIHERWRQFWRQRKQYEFKLALFIKDNYDLLAEHRWKYILEFNQLKDKVDNENEKIERELLRYIKIAGAESLLMNDVIPERHRILEYVPKLKGAPVPPVFEIHFNHQLFRKKFKVYYETVSNKAKNYRKYFN